MYFLYKKETKGNKTVFQRLNQVSLAGSKFGLIVNYLRKTVRKGDTEPFEWHISIGDMFQKLNLNGNCLVVDAKPRSKKEVSLFNIINIWGYSSCDWTPILLELKPILDDEDPNLYDRTNFALENYNDDTSVFTLLYLSGSIKDGEIFYEWLFPGPSPTNSVLLWPGALDYFAKKMGYIKK